MAVKIIADLGSNWRAYPEEPLEEGWKRIQRMIEHVKEAGADVFKMQYLRCTVYPKGSDAAKLVADYEWPTEWLVAINQECGYHDGVELMCTVYEAEHVESVNPYVKRHKIASFDVQNAELLRAVSVTNKPVIVSTGMSTWPAVVGALDRAWIGRQRATLLHCVSAYPAKPEQMNLLALQPLQEGAPGFDYGLSDHTLGWDTTAAVMAVALGASVIEKHITEDNEYQSPDAHFAATPEQFASYVRAIRRAEEMLGDGEKRLMDGEWTQYRYDPKTGKRGV